MRKFLVLGLALVCGVCFGQESYLNNDGTISDEFKRQSLLSVFNENSKDGNIYQIDDKYFVVVTKYDCGVKKYDPEEMQKRAMSYSFNQILKEINSFKIPGYKMFSDIKFEGIIFKTNTICMNSTRRYTFKFTLNELNNFPEYMDYNELVNYVLKNQNRNIISVKNGLE